MVYYYLVNKYPKRLSVSGFRKMNTLKFYFCELCIYNLVYLVQKE